jgi:REP element-mobilizing transposase RayT
MPGHVLAGLRREWERLEKQAPRAGETSVQRKIRESKIVFAMADRYLDCTTEGPMHLKNAEAAKVVEDSILFGISERYEVFAWCVMANHVHILLGPYCELKDITHGIKGYTAYKINALQNQRGRVFWQDESYDHWVRDEAESLRIIEYIENYPVVAGLCRSPEDWPWSSARFRGQWLAGRPLVKK